MYIHIYKIGTCSPLIMFVCRYILLSSYNIYVALFNHRVNYFTVVAVRLQSSPSPDNVVTYGITQSWNKSYDRQTIAFSSIRGVYVCVSTETMWENPFVRAGKSSIHTISRPINLFTPYISTFSLLIIICIAYRSLIQSRFNSKRIIILFKRRDID